MRFICNFKCSEEEALSVLLEPRSKIAVDIETVSLKNILPLGIGLAVSPTRGYYFFNIRDELLHQVIDNVEVISFHNGKFDIPLLLALGYNINSYEDTKMIAYSAGILDNSLNALSFSILFRDCPSVTSQWKKKDQGNIAIDQVKMGGMCIIHACNTYALEEKLPKTELYKDIDKPCVELLMEMEKWGVLVDQHRLTEVEQETMAKVNQLEQDLKEELGDINFASNPQVAAALRDKGIIGTRKTKAGKEAVSEESLRPLNHPTANKLLEHRSEMKTLTTYVPSFRSPDINGRIHTRFGYTDTGRWSSSAPNLQNITRNDKEHEYGLRDCIVAEEGYTFLSLDASQIELRVVAILSQDPKLLEDLQTGDLHQATAIRMFGWTEDKEEMKQRRYNAKQGNFADIYGADEYKLSEMLGCSLEEARAFRRERLETYPVLYQWIEGIKVQAREDGYVTNFFNRIRPIPELTSGSWKLREKGDREAVNTVVQGMAADIIKKMMLYLKGVISSRVRLVLQVHDEVILEVPDELLPEVLEQSKELELAFPDYPVVATVGRSYGKLEEVNNVSDI